MNDTLLALTVLGALVVFLFICRYRKQKTPQAPQHASLEKTPARSPQLPSDYEDKHLVDEAASVRAHWDQQRQFTERSHLEEMQLIKDKLEQALDIVTVSGVGDAACAILKVMWHWPSWSQREGWKMPVHVDNLSGGPLPKQLHGDGEGKWLSWSLNGRDAHLELSIAPNYNGEGSHSGDLKLMWDDTLVMRLDVLQGHEDEYYVWRVFGVSAFKIGPWMSLLNEFAGRIRIASEQGQRDHQKSFYGSKASQVDLGEPF